MINTVNSQYDVIDSNVPWYFAPCVQVDMSRVVHEGEMWGWMPLVSEIKKNSSCFITLTRVLYAMSCCIGPHYNGARLLSAQILENTFTAVKYLPVYFMALFPYFGAFIAYVPNFGQAIILMFNCLSVDTE